MPTDRGEEGDLRSASSFHGNSARKSVFMSYGLTYISPKVVFHSGGVFVGFYDSLHVLNTVLYIISPNVTTEGNSIHSFYIPILTRTFIFVLRIFIFT